MTTTARQFLSLVSEAHGHDPCSPSVPQATSMFVARHANIIIYDVWLMQGDVTIQVAMPISSAIYSWFLLRNPSGTENRLEPPTDEDLRGLEIRALDAIAYALTFFSAMPPKVQNYLLNRFGPTLKEVRKMGEQRWRDTAHVG